MIKSRDWPMASAAEKAKNTLSTGIPKLDQPLDICGNDGIAATRQ
jgi:hypothetical protein